MWVIRELGDTREKERWWDISRLKSLPSIGHDWSYGETFMLNRYSRAISPLYIRSESQKGALEQMVILLSKRSDSNSQAFTA